MTKKRCCWGRCNSDTRYYHKDYMKGVTFKPFPKPTTDLKRCKEWIRLCNRPQLSVDKIGRYHFVCSKHFTDGCDYPEQATVVARPTKKSNTPGKRQSPTSRSENTTWGTQLSIEMSCPSPIKEEVVYTTIDEQAASVTQVSLPSPLGGEPSLQKPKHILVQLNSGVEQVVKMLTLNALPSIFTVTPSWQERNEYKPPWMNSRSESLSAAILPRNGEPARDLNLSLRLPGLASPQAVSTYLPDHLCPTDTGTKEMASVPVEIQTDALPQTKEASQQTEILMSSLFAPPNMDGVTGFKNGHREQEENGLSVQEESEDACEFIGLEMRCDPVSCDGFTEDKATNTSIKATVIVQTEIQGTANTQLIFPCLRQPESRVTGGRTLAYENKRQVAIERPGYKFENALYDKIYSSNHDLGITETIPQYFQSFQSRVCKGGFLHQEGVTVGLATHTAKPSGTEEDSASEARWSKCDLNLGHRHGGKEGMLGPSGSEENCSSESNHKAGLGAYTLPCMELLLEDEQRDDSVPQLAVMESVGEQTPVKTDFVVEQSPVRKWEERDIRAMQAAKLFVRGEDGISKASLSKCSLNLGDGHGGKEGILGPLGSEENFGRESHHKAGLGGYTLPCMELLLEDEEQNASKPSSQVRKGEERGISNVVLGKSTGDCEERPTSNSKGTPSDLYAYEHGLVICKLCTGAFLSEKEFLDHAHKIHNYHFPQCLEIFKKTRKLSTKAGGGSKKVGQCYMCEKCGITVTSLVGLTKHLVTHTNLKPHKCDTCGRQFSSKYYLQKHLSIHTGEKPYKCPVCSRAFRQPTPMRIHLRLHTGEKPYSCHLCDKKFVSYACKYSHMKTHTGGRKFYCYACKKAFFSIKSLQKHVQEDCKLS